MFGLSFIAIGHVLEKECQTGFLKPPCRNRWDYYRLRINLPTPALLICDSSLAPLLTHGADHPMIQNDPGSTIVRLQIPPSANCLSCIIFTSPPTLMASVRFGGNLTPRIRLSSRCMWDPCDYEPKKHWQKVWLYLCYVLTEKSGSKRWVKQCPQM